LETLGVRHSDEVDSCTSDEVVLLLSNCDDLGSSLSPWVDSCTEIKLEEDASGAWGVDSWYGAKVGGCCGETEVCCAIERSY